jgi:hypothetical protein
VEIGADEPVLPNDKARAFALHRLRHAATLTRIVIVRRLEEQIVQRGVVPVGLFCHLDDDDTWRHDLENLGESAVQLMNNILPGAAASTGIVGVGCATGTGDAGATDAESGWSGAARSAVADETARRIKRRKQRCIRRFWTEARAALFK